MSLRSARLNHTPSPVEAHQWEGGPGVLPDAAAKEVQNSVLPFPQQPMLARSVASLPDDDELPGGSVYEPKFDGHRALVFVMPGWCRIQSRHGRDITASFPEIVAAVLEYVPAGVILDGELVVWGTDTSDFTELQRRLGDGGDRTPGPTHPASFIAFDVLAGAGMDMRASPLRVRRQALTILLDDAPAPLHVVPQTRDAEEARTWIVNYSEAHVGIDGVVAKGLATPYASGERGWQQLPIRHSVECVVAAVLGSLRAPTRLLLGRPDADGGLQLEGSTTDLTLPQSRRLGRLLSAADDSHPWSDLPLAEMSDWSDAASLSTLVAPTTVVEVTAGQTTAADDPREARELIRLRPEMMPGEIAAAPTGD